MTNNQHSYSGKPVSLRSFFAKYLRYWYLFVIMITIALGGAYLYLRYATPVYQINAVLLLKKEDKSLNGESILSEKKALSDEKNIENEIETLKSRSLIQRVVDNLNLTVSYFQKGQVRSSEEVYTNSPIRLVARQLTPLAYKDPILVRIVDKDHYEVSNNEGKTIGRYKFDTSVKNEIGQFTTSLVDSLYSPDNVLVDVSFSNEESVVQTYQTALKVELLNQKSTVLKLGLESTVSAKGKDVLNELLKEYRNEAISARNNEAGKALRFIDERLKLISSQLGAVEKSVESYKSGEGITDLSAEGNLFLSSVKNNDDKLNELSVQLKVLNSVERYLKSSVNGAAPATLMANDPVLTGLLTKLNELESQEEKYSRTTQLDNPYRQTTIAQIASTKKSILEYIDNQRENLLVSQNSLKQINNQLTTSIRTIPRKEREFLDIKRQQAIKENLYVLLLNKKEETAISYASSSVDSQIMDYPYSLPHPVKPNRSSIYLLAFFAGLLIPLGFISVRGMLNDTVQSRKEIEDETGIMLFGEITKKPKNVKSNIVDLNSHTIIAEQFKILRANLQYKSKKEFIGEGQTILVTSSVSGEGKSFVSINLSLSMALLDKKVIVVELDLRQPQIEKYLGMSNFSASGMSDYLLGNADAEDIIQKTGINPNLYLISSGQIPENPTELLSNGNIKFLLEKLRNQFDYIILDTPPVSMLADASLLSDYADTTLYVVRHQYTPRTYMPFLSKLNESNKFKSLNLIVNAVDYPNAEDFGYGYAYPKRKSYQN